MARAVNPPGVSVRNESGGFGDVGDARIRQSKTVEGLKRLKEIEECGVQGSINVERYDGETTTVVQEMFKVVGRSAVHCHYHSQQITGITQEQDRMTKGSWSTRWSKTPRP